MANIEKGDTLVIHAVVSRISDDGELVTFHIPQSTVPITAHVRALDDVEVIKAGKRRR